MKIEINPAGYWGKRPYYYAKIGTGPSNLILIKRARRFAPRMQIQFSTLSDVGGMCIGVAPMWRQGTILKIEDDRLFISL